MKFKQILKTLRYARFTFEKINQHRIVIYDDIDSVFLRTVTGSDKVIEIRGEIINTRILLSSIFRRDFLKNPLQVYGDEFIRRVNARYVVTAVDNNPAFFRLSERVPGLTTIMLQNGNRDNVADIFARTNLIGKVDYSFVFGKAMESYLGKIIESEIESIGSFRSNEVEKARLAKPRTVLFISQIASDPLEQSFMHRADGSPISYSDFYTAEQMVLPLVVKWCEARGYELQVLARSKLQYELDFYNQVLGSDGWVFVGRSEQTCSYTRVDEAEIVVSIDSTLGVESLGRGVRTALFAVREKYVADWPMWYWPDELDLKGLFWSDEATYSEIERVLNFHSTVESNNWEKICDEMRERVIAFDCGNLILKEKINAIFRN
jgi:surface carbohydrate biosynthesis protein